MKLKTKEFYRIARGFDDPKLAGKLVYLHEILEPRHGGPGHHVEVCETGEFWLVRSSLLCKPS